jgi:hypothetical protein
MEEAGSSETSLTIQEDINLNSYGLGNRSSIPDRSFIFPVASLHVRLLMLTTGGGGGSQYAQSWLSLKVATHLCLMPVLNVLENYLSLLWIKHKHNLPSSDLRFKVQSFFISIASLLATLSRTYN